MTLQRCLLLAVLAMLSACAGRQVDPVASEELARGAAQSGTISSSESMRPGAAEAIERALRNPARPAADRRRDEQRRAAEVLKFFGIQPGMTVLDLYSGGGYYTELLAYVVGDNGTVVAHNNTPYLNLAREEIERRYAANRLPNVEQLRAENDQLVLEAGRYDAVLMILAYHDVYYVDRERGWEPIDADQLLAEIYQAMKPGAVLGVIDHVAAPGTPPEEADTLHRIDPAVIRADLGAAGFVFEAQTDILRNPEDDLSVSPFDPSVRGRTDRVVMRFRKPWPAPRPDE